MLPQNIHTSKLNNIKRKQEIVSPKIIQINNKQPFYHSQKRNPHLTLESPRRGNAGIPSMEYTKFVMNMNPDNADNYFGKRILKPNGKRIHTEWLAK